MLIVVVCGLHVIHILKRAADYIVSEPNLFSPFVVFRRRMNSSSGETTWTLFVSMPWTVTACLTVYFAFIFLTLSRFRSAPAITSVAEPKLQLFPIFRADPKAHKIRALKGEKNVPPAYDHPEQDASNF